MFVRLYQDVCKICIIMRSFKDIDVRFKGVKQEVFCKYFIFTDSFT